MDFGLSNWINDVHQFDEDNAQESQALLGKARYMAPERIQAVGAASIATFASDIYAFGMLSLLVSS